MLNNSCITVNGSFSKVNTNAPNRDENAENDHVLVGPICLIAKYIKTKAIPILNIPMKNR